MTFLHVFNMKNCIKMMITILHQISDFQHFQQVIKTTILGKRLDDTSHRHEKLEALGKDIWD